MNQLTASVGKKLASYFGFRITNAKCRWGVDHIDDILKVVGNPSRVRCIFDVGANIGENALAYAKRFPSATIFAFEPVDETFSRLQQNLREHRQILPVHCALGDFNGRSRCNLHADSRNNTLIGGLKDVFHSNPSGDQEVRVSTLDTYFTEQGIESVDLLKIDTEGFDLAVLRGASETLRRKQIKFIYFEFHHLLPGEDTGQLGSLVPIAEFLHRFDFRFLTVYTDSVHGNESMGTYNALFLSGSSEYSWKY